MSPHHQKTTLSVAIVLLVAGAAFVAFGLQRPALPVRLALATMDLIIAALLFVALRQRRK